jgi:hypothetical protein
MTIELAPGDWDRILAWIRRADQHDAHVWAWVASGIRGANQDELADAMLIGLRKRIRTPCPEAGARLHGSYMTPEVGWIGLFIRAAARVDPACMQPRLKAAAALSEDPVERMWLFIARGQCGDRDVKEPLERWINDPELALCIRAQALRAYSKAVKHEAIPLLEAYKNDQTRDPPWLVGPPMSTVARSELARLGAWKAEP